MTIYRTIGTWCALTVLIASCGQHEEPYNGWTNYGGTKANAHYSSLTTVDTNNVQQLKVAWTYHTGDADTALHSQIQCNPIVVNGILYGTSPTLKLFAVEAATGKELWSFDPNDSSKRMTAGRFIVTNNRGVTYWSEGNDQRILYAAGYWVFAVNATTGKLIDSFGTHGRINLHDGLGRDVKDLFVIATSPGIIYKDVYILGSRVAESADAAPGHIRGYDVRTGKQRWIFHTIPQPGETGHETWEDPNAWKHVGGANSWSGFTLDETRGILFAPTGSASPDFYGGRRKGENLFANCLLALDAATGKYIWHYQFVRHDLWDRDLPTPPVLVTVIKHDNRVAAVAQVTKHGMIFVFARENGKPLFYIEDRPVDSVSDLAGEKVWPKQPFATRYKPFVRQEFTPDSLNPYLPDSSLAKLRKDIEGYKYGKMFQPPSTQTMVLLPGLDGGAEWGGPAYDPESGHLYINANEMPWLITMRENKLAEAKTENYGAAGKRLYEQHCLTCHGADRKGTGNNPSLLGLSMRYKEPEVLSLLHTGRRMMPGFGQLDQQEKEAIASFILEAKAQQQKAFTATSKVVDSFLTPPYSMTGYYKFLSPEGYPAIKPPWGTLTAINLHTGAQVWKTTLGEYPELTAKGVPPTGTENYGGPVVTAGGLLFIAAARDGKFRAYRKSDGKLLWEYTLPAPGFATPAVYEANGKQYIVIACGGGKLGTRSGDAYVAFALP